MKINFNKAFIIENMCSLMTTIGSKFCKSCPTESQNFFTKLDQLKDSSSLSIKDKFGIMELLETAQKKNWIN